MRQLFGWWLSRLRQGDFNQKRSTKRISEVDEDALLAIVENKPKISKEDIAKTLEIDISNVFRYLKRLEFCKNGHLDNLERYQFPLRQRKTTYCKTELA